MEEEVEINTTLKESDCTIKTPVPPDTPVQLLCIRETVNDPELDNECMEVPESICAVRSSNNIVPDMTMVTTSEQCSEEFEAVEELAYENTAIKEDMLSQETVSKPLLNFDCPKILTGAWNEFKPKKNHKEIFLKGCKWSPDGTCLLTNSDDATMRLFNLPLELYNCQRLPQHVQFPELQPAVTTKVRGLVYDYAWYPRMNSADPYSCFFVTSSFCAPVQQWDAYNGTLRSSYMGYNTQDEMHAALSVTFNPCGDLLFCGYKNCINIFLTDRPGKESTVISTKELSEQKGIVSSIAVNPSMPSIFAAGTYTKNIGLYSTDGHALCLLTGHRGGLTQLMFTQDGSCLLSAGRKDSEILCWDIRHLGRILWVLQRPHTTNQRIYFDLSTDDRYLLSGSSDGEVRVWDLQTIPCSIDITQNSVIEPFTHWNAHNDCVNGLSVHRQIPVVATASGQRYIPDLVDHEDDDMVFVADRPCNRFEDSVKLWWAGDITEQKMTEENHSIS